VLAKGRVTERAGLVELPATSTGEPGHPTGQTPCRHGQRHAGRRRRPNAVHPRRPVDNCVGLWLPIGNRLDAGSCCGPG